MTTFIRWQHDKDRRTPIGRFKPLTADHPFLREVKCSECNEPFQVGEAPCLFAVGPITRDDAEKADAGRWYSALAVAMHERCGARGMP